MAKVTIGLPVYNGARTIARALDCLLGQSFADFELVISDNASSDATGEICAAYAARDARVRYLRQPVNLGAAMNFRFVLFEARSEYFMWAAADDLWAPGFIARNLAVLEARPDVVLSQSRVLFSVDGAPANLSTGTYGLMGDVRANCDRFLTNPADNSRYYGVFRTAALRAVYPARAFYALDWAVSAMTLRHGRHYEVPEILMIRDTTDATAYERGVGAAHKSVLFRVFPLLYMTVWFLMRGRVPVSAAILYRLAKLNIYMNLRFGMYRWKALAELYLANNAARRSPLILFLRLTSRAFAPGLGPRLAAGWLKARRRVKAGLYFFWRAAPLRTGQRESIKRVVLEALGMVGYGPRRTSRPELGDSAPHPRPPPPLPLSGWALPRPLGGVRPALSVVVAAPDDLLGSLALLDSVARAQGELPVEVVLAGDGGDATALALQAAGCVVYDGSATGWFGEAANRAARLAGAGVLVFTEPRVLFDERFLCEILAPLGPLTMAGPQLRTWDGMLAAAGGIAGAGDWPRGHGAGGDPLDPAFLFARDVDYSLGAFAMRREIFFELGGFDAGYRSFEAAGLELATRLQGRGGKCRYWPAAVASDWSGRPHSRYAGVMATGADGEALRADWTLFKSRHADVLARRGAAERRGQPAHDRACARKLLFVDADTPRHDQSAGALLALNMIRIYTASGIRVSFVPDSNMAYAPGYTAGLQLLGVEMLYAPYVRSADDVLARADRYDVAVLNRGEIAARWMEKIHAKTPGLPVVFIPVDLHFLREMREAELLNDSRMMARAEAVRATELAVVARADATIVLSTHEAEILRQAVPAARVRVVPLILEMPEQAEQAGQAGPGARRDVVFVGTYQHPPNRDAAIYFAREVWPAFHERFPQARFLVVGACVTPDILALQGDGIEVLGFVKELDPVLAGCRMSVAPLRFGAGIKGKVASSLLAGVPVVASPIAVEGTPLRDGVEVLVADSPAAFAEAMARLYEDDALWLSLSAAGRDFVRREYSVGVNTARMLDVLADIGLVLPAASAAPALEAKFA
jgi:glycosyltransferase involved in cell wall biosynthesis